MISESGLEISPLPYPSWQLHQKAYFRLDQVVLQYPHYQWSSVMIPGLLIIGLSSLAYASRRLCMQEGMLPYMIATNQYNFPVLIHG